MGELQRMYDEVPPPSPEVLAEGRARLVALAREGGAASWATATSARRAPAVGTGSAWPRAAPER